MANEPATGRSILITGCSSGIGRWVAGGLLRRGYRVFATARRERDVESLAADGLEALRLDVTDGASMDAALDTILGRTGGTLGALFNNAGYGQPGALEDLPLEALRKQFETNVFGTHELTRRVIPVMRAQGHGRILQHSSVLGFVALKYRGAYNASKYALEGLTDTLRLELADTEIHVVLIEPGPIESRFRENAYRAFQENIDAEHSVHGEAYSAMVRRLTTEGPAVPFTLPPEAVFKKVVHALESRRPGLRYPVTFPSHLFALLKRVLSHRLLDAVLLKV